jgi:formylglycine-generating enzyme required for sulfatase activity
MKHSVIISGSIIRNRKVPTITPFLPWVSRADPLVPSNPQPPSGASGQSPNVYLTWGTLEPTDQPLYYEIALEANNPQPTQLIAAGLQRSAFDPVTFAPDTQYYWQVTVTDLGGNRIAGPVWTFRVERWYDPPRIGAMVQVPAGEFKMGCDRATTSCWLQRELPLHVVYLDAFEIDKYEVTNKEYRACEAAGVCNPPRRFDSPGRSSYYHNAEYDLYPVMYVSWNDAQNFCGWLGKRLPTEAEWEKAAKGAIDTRPWPWGWEGATCDRANYYADCGSRTSRVGSYPASASPYGAMDMAGNMFEWVFDKFDVTYYTYSPYANPTGPDTSLLEGKEDRESMPYYSIRSGSYHDNWYYARTTHRHWGHHGDRAQGDAPLFRSFRVGIRCARSLTP